MKMGCNILNVFGLGKLPFSASAASLLIVPVYWAICKWCPYPFYVNAGLFLLILGWSVIVINKYASWAEADPKEIVVDEVMGMHITLILAHSVNIYILGGLFVLFRIFDILKPFPFHLIEKKLNGKYGVLWDDIAIGIFLGGSFFLVNKYADLGF
jgi:phosphatidylglycerophosphatase A